VLAWVWGWDSDDHTVAAIVNSGCDSGVPLPHSHISSSSPLVVLLLSALISSFLSYTLAGTPSRSFDWALWTHEATDMVRGGEQWWEWVQGVRMQPSVMALRR
jgi:hypothetical protein